MKDYLFIQDAHITRMNTHFSSLVHKRDMWLCGFEEFSYQRKDYAVVVDGELYNESEIKEELRQAQFPVMETIEEVFVYSYLHWGVDMYQHLIGAYGFVLLCEDHLIAMKDPLGLALMYYVNTEDSFIITNSIDLLLKNTRTKAVMGKQEICNLFAFGPGMPMDQTILKHVQQLPMGSYLKKKENIEVQQYYQLKAKPHTDNLTDTIETVHDLLSDSIHRQKAYAHASFLSGGLDSSIITALCANKDDAWHTYSLEYEGNKENFKGNLYQVALDDDYIKQMLERYPTQHTTCTITQDELAQRLKDAMLARGFPGMADIDSSLLWLCENVGSVDQVILSGECSDEIFGGYPWFYRDELANLDTFPWLRSSDERISLLHPQLQSLDIKGHIQHLYESSIQDVTYLKSDSKEDRRARKQTVLCLQWFMQTLVVRQLAMAKASDITIRAPFADVALLEYVYNIPWNMKFYKQNEKGILRKAFEKQLPHDVCWRKKNPFPKTHDPYYAELAAALVQNCYEDKSSPLHQLFDDDALKQLIDTKGASFPLPWYGQLMSGPQLLAYLYQIDCWMREYQVQIDLRA